jgi:hypothetical protein
MRVEASCRHRHRERGRDRAPLAADRECSVDVGGGVRRTEFRPQCPELLSPARGTQAGWFPPQQCRGQQHGAPQLGRRHRQARQGTWLRTGPPRSPARRMATTSGLSVMPRISAWASSREGASLFSEARRPVSVGSSSSWRCSVMANTLGGRTREACRATPWRTIWSATATPSVTGLAARKARGAPPNNAMQLTRGGWIEWRHHRWQQGHREPGRGRAPLAADREC